MKRAGLVLLSLLLASPLVAATRRSDDSCDIAVLPAATLLLPYFEVDVGGPPASSLTTLLSLVNTSREPQIAHITLWTDWGYPLFGWNVVLTGYDVQSFNLRDVLGGNIVTARAGVGSRSSPVNPQLLPAAAADCASPPSQIPAAVRDDLLTALTAGLLRSCGMSRVVV